MVLVAGAVAWLTMREPNPVKWPALVLRDAAGLLADAREALVDGTRAGTRAERAFDADMAEARSRAHRG